MPLAFLTAWTRSSGLHWPGSYLTAAALNSQTAVNRYWRHLPTPSTLCAVDRSEDWLKQAERDLRAAENSAASGYHEWAAFAAQQCAEKAVKALAESLHGSPRGHSISGLLRSLKGAADVPDEALDAAGELDQVYVTARYPNGFPSGIPGDYFSEKTSRRLIDHARSILEFCRSKIR